MLMCALHMRILIDCCIQPTKPISLIINGLTIVLYLLDKMDVVSVTFFYGGLNYMKFELWTKE